MQNEFSFTSNLRTCKKRIFFYKYQTIYHKITLFLMLWILISSPLLSKYKSFYSYYNFFYGAKALAMGNAYTAFADDLSAVFWNPAGIADFQYPIAFLNIRSDSLTHVYDLQEYNFNTYSQRWTSDFESKLENIDFFSVSVPAVIWDVKWNFALSYYRFIPYNFNGSWKGILTTISENTNIEKIIEDFSGNHGIDVLGFSVACYFSEYFTVGLTLQYFFNSGTIRYNFESTDLKYNVEYTEKLEGQNLIVGCKFKPYKSIHFGFAYHTRLKNTLASDYQYDEINDTGFEENSCSCEVYIPPQFSLGIVITPHKSFKVAYDFSKVLWSKGKISEYYGHEEDLPFPVRDDFTINQANTLNHRIGVEANFSAQNTIFYIRGGLFWDRQLYVDTTENHIWIKGFSVGLGVNLFSMIILDLAYMRQIASWKEIGYFSEESLADTHFKNNIFALSLTYIFKKKS